MPSTSLVVPAFNEEHRIGATLEGLLAFFESRREDFEIVVVDDGSRDSTAEVVRAFPSPPVRLLVLPDNQGKGAALRLGVEESRGEFIYLIDADLPYDPAFFEEARQVFQEKGGEAVLGARDLVQSSVDPSYPRLRVWMGKAFGYLANVLLPLGVLDTQCGFKGFRAPLLKELLLFSTRNDYTLDIELILLLRRWGIPLHRIPVRLLHHHGSKIRILRDSLAMLRSLLEISRHHYLGHYPQVKERGHYRALPCPACGRSCYRVEGLKKGFRRLCFCLLCHRRYWNPQPAGKGSEGL